jgi:hypothetical protein
MELIKGDYPFYIGEYSIHIFTPTVEWKFGGEYNESLHVGLNTQILYRRPKDGWSWHWSFVFRILGFGFGIAHQHCDNPNWKARKEDCKK